MEAKVQKSNKYLDFIEKCKAKEHSPNTYLEKHRIVPGHQGGTYEEGNYIYLTFEDHKEAHKIRYEVYGDDFDDLAYKIMSGQVEDVRRAISIAGGKKGGAETQNRRRLTEEYFFSEDWQKNHGGRGGGKANVASGLIDRLNKKSKEEGFLQQKQAGQRSKAATEARKAYSDSRTQAMIVKISNKSERTRFTFLLVWGILLNGQNIPFNRLSSDFINYFIKQGNKLYDQQKILHKNTY